MSGLILTACELQIDGTTWLATFSDGSAVVDAVVVDEAVGKALAALLERFGK